ncbi:kinetochore Sim4 complex subunit Fta4 [Durotheca rogersii]|uniref:kinetochore Sim4 complex subunit Fta4 n=1 Tax=Durotheca rogersii TaxID=419775 RepID=UPI0022207981|nr:kinetochore Sim4 complex subunit Fta4 [Durotheca rogersii]KAI5860851.1 kinetochore Sim4 complex subunit Fta4 [Durotheca rogersii]
MAPPTILAHKSSFLTAQTLQLSQALAPSATWRAANERLRASDGGSVQALPERAVDEALYRANHVLLQHARRAYAPQASRHVAEQIEMLYHEAAERAVRGDDDDRGGDSGEEEEGEVGGEGAGEGEATGRRRTRVRIRDDGVAGFLRLNADFASDAIISSLPASWDLHSPAQADARPAEAARFAELSASLTALAARRAAACDRLARLHRMRDLLAPFAPAADADAGGAVQPNLVTRDGDVERELERMRMLLVRVSARVAQLPEPEPGAEATVQDVEAAERGKVERLLDSF